jgi:hypothetical protein
MSSAASLRAEINTLDRKIANTNGRQMSPKTVIARITDHLKEEKKTKGRFAQDIGVSSGTLGRVSLRFL